MRAHEIFGEHVRANGFAAGVPDLAKNMRTACEFPWPPAIEILFSAGDKIVARLA